MSASLDLRKAHRHHRRGDLIVVLTWVNDMRTLVLMPALRKNAGWYMVAESAAYKWGVDHPDPRISRPAKKHAVVQSNIACWMLNQAPSKKNRGLVIDIVTGWLPDLIRMPSAPLPEYMRGSLGQMILRADGKQIAAEDVRLEVAGAEYG